MVTKHVSILGKAPSARGTALMIVRPAHNRTEEQTAYLAQLTQSDSTVAKAFTLAQDGCRNCCANTKGSLVWSIGKQPFWRVASRNSWTLLMDSPMMQKQ